MHRTGGRLCQACSEGKVEHDHSHASEHAQRYIGLAAPSEAAVRAVIEPFLESLAGASLNSIECALPHLPVH